MFHTVRQVTTKLESDTTTMIAHGSASEEHVEVTESGLLSLLESEGNKLRLASPMNQIGTAMAPATTDKAMDVGAISLPKLSKSDGRLGLWPMAL